MPVTIGSYQDRASELLVNAKVLRDFVQSYEEQLKFLKEQAHISEEEKKTINTLYDKSRHANDFYTQLVPLGERAEKLMLTMLEWNETIDSCNSSQVKKEFNERREKHIAEQRLKEIKKEYKTEISENISSIIGVLNEAVKHDVLTAPLGLEKGNLFLTELNNQASLVSRVGTLFAEKPKPVTAAPSQTSQPRILPRIHV